MRRPGGYRLQRSALAAALLLCAATSGAAAPVAHAVHGGSLWLRPNPDLFATLGVAPEGVALRSQWSIALQPRTPVEVELGDGAPTRIVSGEVAAPALRLRRSDGARSAPLTMRPDPVHRLGWQFVDARGEVWLRITHGMRSPERERDGLRLFTADLRVGPALAAWSGVDAEGRLLANAALQLPLEASPAAARAKSCAAPNWPGTAGFVADVELVDMIDVGGVGGIDVMRCRTAGMSGCDGPGGADGDVVFVPSALLRNRTAADAADLPWHTKFSGVFPPYGNDQHPYLVWNFYRLGADGSIDQIARSGLKHAFATANEQCIDLTCPPSGQIIGRGCSDIYNAGSNDLAFFLSSRDEIIPSRGIWGRCGSVFDDLDNNPSDGLPGCDGVQDAAPADDGYRERMIARETDIDVALHPGAEWLIDAWYVVRDDIDILNTMGHRSLRPEFTNGLWRPGPLGAFEAGAVIDGWLARAASGEQRHRAQITGDEGQIGVATRVLRLPDGRYRYDYALMNFDFARVAVDPNTSEPNLRFFGSAGIDGVAITLANGALADAQEFRDGDAAGANDWTFAGVPGELRWSSPPTAMLRWGNLVFARVVSAAAPGFGEVRFDVGTDGTPASYATQTLVPDGEKLFRDGFE